MLILVHENLDKLTNVTAVRHFSRGFDYSNLVNSFRGSKYLPKIELYKIKLCVYFRI